jgi:hypothetical protein
MRRPEQPLVDALLRKLGQQVAAQHGCATMLGYVPSLSALDRAALGDFRSLDLISRLAFLFTLQTPRKQPIKQLFNSPFPFKLE